MEGLEVAVELKRGRAPAEVTLVEKEPSKDLGVSSIPLATSVLFKRINIEKRQLDSAVVISHISPPLVEVKLRSSPRLLKSGINIEVAISAPLVVLPRVSFNNLNIKLKSLETNIDIKEKEIPRVHIKFIEMKINKVRADSEIPPSGGGDQPVYLESLFEEVFGEGFAVANMSIPVLILYDDDDELAYSLATIASEVLLVEYGIAVEAQTTPTAYPYGSGIYIIRKDRPDKDDVGTMIGYVPKVVIARRSDEIKNSVRGRARVIEIKERVNRCKLACLAYAACGFCSEEILQQTSPSVLSSYKWGEDALLRKALDSVPTLKNRPSIGEVESHYHRYLKLFAVYHFMYNEGIRPEDIYVEDEAEGLCKYVPDVYVRRLPPIIVDAKTCVKELPTDAILKAVEKYRSCVSDGEIWIVLRPIVVLLYTKGIKKILKELNKSIRVKVVVPIKDGEKLSLVSFNEFVKRVRECIKKCN
ncbi:hypothetical protein [Pyrobaculum aerophilum]|uniref:Uncharacterized protein n=1 Tax=Pyrobaculum aerophilum TaxID=13773 RepID=A0A371QZR4_9CREN|nr:hypothetical protein [Pyrobaculum aerophilum]RFA96256.1 hypothetical protein CGL51_05485 [Pyrobaculum aerophilum]RFB00365.1 hypothetical protein CGL52_00445 [Pyrobaculum aerophilum]